MAFGRLLGGLFSGDRIGDDFWEGLEEALIVSDIGMDTTLRLIGGLRERIESDTTPDGIRVLLRSEIAEILSAAKTNGHDESATLPTVVLMVGVNGAGKTTSIAKLAHAARGEGRKVLLAAADTFRAGAIEQLQEWGRRLRVDVIAHAAGGDPGAVAFDAMAAARARSADLVLIDTAGRLHTRHNLMEELKKVSRIVEREAGDYVLSGLLVMDATTGQNGLPQARAFTEAVDCDGVFLAKLDGTARGGIVLAIASELGLPVHFIGTGESQDDISPFDATAFAETLVPDPGDSS